MTSPERGVALDLGDDGFHVGQIEALAAEAGDVGGEFGGIEAVVFRDLVEIGEGGDDGEVREGEGLGEFVLEDGAAGGVGARFEEDPQARVRVALAQALHGEADGGRVVGEVVDDLDAVDLAAEFLAAGDAFEGFEPGADFIGVSGRRRWRRRRPWRRCGR